MLGAILPERRRKEQDLPSEDYVRQAMPQTLGTFGMTMIFLMVTFFINNPAGTAGGGIASFTYWGIGTLVFFLPCVIATAQLGTMFFHEGSLYNWTQKALGSFWSFFVGVSFWVSGLLGMIGSASIVVTFLQGVNGNWLSGSGAQGVLIVFILILSAIVSIQGFRMLQYMVNIIAIVMLCVVALLGLAAVIWLLAGHPVATDFAHSSGLAVQPGNYVLFSTVILAFLGANVSTTLGGEVGDRNVISRHLFRGGLLVLGSYLLVTLALLIVVGPSAAVNGPFSVITIIDLVFGKFAGNIATACVITYFLVLTALFNSIFARLLLVGALDRRLPVGLAKLDENRVPLNAVIFQTSVAVLFTSVVFLLPYLVSFGNPVNLTNELFTVTLYAHSMIWAISSSFLFINLLVLYMQDPRGFHARRIFPMPVLWASIIVAPLACVLAIIVTLSYSPIPQLISNGLWGGVAGGLTLGWLVFAGVASMVASGEASWEDLSAEEKS